MEEIWDLYQKSGYMIYRGTLVTAETLNKQNRSVCRLCRHNIPLCPSDWHIWHSIHVSRGTFHSPPRQWIRPGLQISKYMWWQWFIWTLA